jgi:hypothetical protein
MTDATTTPIAATDDEKLKTRLPRRLFFHDMPDKGLFAAFALGGFTIILGFKTWGISAEVIAILAVASMVMYGVIAYRMPSVQLRLDRLGDNFYYLGFIFTLASMSAAILQVQGGASIEALIGSFGIALFTTIVGVAGRVLFVQMRGELDEIETAVRRDLLETSNALRSQLGIALADFQTFHTAVKQATDESLARTLGATHDHVDRLDRLVSRIAESVDGLTKRLDAAELPAKRWEKSADDFSIHMHTLFTRLDADLHAVLQRLHAVVEVFPVYARRRRRWYWPFSRR